MPDRQKVIKGLECLAQRQEPTANPCKDCGYVNRPNYAICVKDIAFDALALLKEQERIIKQYQKADGFLFAHGWKWEGGEVEMSETNVFEEFIVMRSKGGDGTIYSQRPLVRCKDCKHRPKRPELPKLYEFSIEFPEGSRCPCQCEDDEYYSWYPSDDWFCADGEPK